LDIFTIIPIYSEYRNLPRRQRDIACACGGKLAGGLALL
jgi:hypothetical protein